MTRGLTRHVTCCIKRDVPSQTHTPNLGERIRFARKRAGLSHDRLGAIVGTSRQHLIRIEKGIHKPRPELLGRIAEATGSDLDALLEQSSDDEDEESDAVAALMVALKRFVRAEVLSGA